MSRLESLAQDWRVLRGMLRGMPKGEPAQRLNHFYATQAADYDRFRERLLQGRRELINAFDLPQGAHVVELGGGTGRNLAFFPAQRRADLRFTLVDLCAPLLAQARQRLADWPNVETIEADATRWQPDVPVDCVYFSYALTMIDDWQGAIDNAVAMLKPGGTLGVVDFYVSAKRPAHGLHRHAWLTRQFWPRWFAHDGVQLDARRLDYLRQVLPQHRLVETLANVPYLPGLRVPVYRFVGQR